MTRPFEHGPAFRRMEDTGSFQPAFFEAEYERLYAEALSEGPIGPKERVRLERAAGALKLSKEKIARIEEGMQRAYDARASITLTDFENMPTDHGTAWDDLIRDLASREQPLEATQELGDDDVLSSPSQPSRRTLQARRPPEADPSKQERASSSVFRVAPPAGPSDDIHGRFASASALDERFTAAAVLVRRGEAPPAAQELYSRLRQGVLPRPARSLTTTSWTTALIDPAQERTTSEIFGVIASAVLFARVKAMRVDGVLPTLDPRRRQDPATSTVSAVRALGWCAATLGMTAPAIYLAPDAPVGLEIVPAVPPVAQIGSGLLSGKTVLELAFHGGRFMTWLREEYFICNLMPGIPQLEDVFLAALLIGDPEFELSPGAYERASLNRDVLLPILDEGRLRRLRELTAKFSERRVRLNLREWWSAAERTACRAGLLACGDLEVAASVLLSEPLGAVHLAELESFWASDTASQLRRDLGIAFT
jgi:hypothetical protein